MRTVHYLSFFVLAIALIINADNFFNDGALTRSGPVLSSEPEPTAEPERKEVRAPVEEEEPSYKRKKREGAYQARELSYWEREDLAKKVRETNERTAEKRKTLEGFGDREAVAVQYEPGDRPSGSIPGALNPQDDTGG